MESTFEQWLYDPTIGKFVNAVFINIVLLVPVRFAHRLLGKYVGDIPSGWDPRY